MQFFLGLLNTRWYLIGPQSTGPTKSKGESLHVRLHTDIGNDLFQQKVIMIIDFTTHKFQGLF